MSESRAEGAALISDVAFELARPEGSANLVATVRNLQHACTLLKLETEVAWFHAELLGYQVGQVPQHRNVYSVVRWMSTANPFLLGSAPSVLSETTGIWPLGTGLADIIRHAEGGYDWFYIDPPPQESTPVPTANSFARQQVAIHADAVRGLIDRIEQYCAAFAIRLDVDLRFGDVVGSIFEDYRNAVQSALATTGITNSLSVIEANIQVGTREAAGAAMLAARNVLLGLSRQLWQVPNLPAHPTLRDRSGQPLQLGDEQPKARLRAFLHEHGVALTRSNRSTLISGQVERASDTVDDLYNLLSDRGRAQGAPEDARAAVLQLYLVVGEISRLTGLVPITDLSGTVPPNAAPTSSMLGTPP